MKLLIRHPAPGDRRSSHLGSGRGRRLLPGHTHPPPPANRHAPVVQHPSHIDSRSCCGSSSGGNCVCGLPQSLGTRARPAAAPRTVTTPPPTPTLGCALGHLSVVGRQMSRKAGGTSERSSAAEHGGPTAELYKSQKPRCALARTPCLLSAEAKRTLAPSTCTSQACIFFLGTSGWMQNSSSWGEFILELQLLYGADVTSPSINSTDCMSSCCP